MLKEKQWPSSDAARTTRATWDITELRPIPRGAALQIQDFDPAQIQRGYGS
jgi:hypothetical protein